MSEPPEHPETQGQCPFCTEAASSEHVVAEFGTVVAIADLAPVAEGHLLIITRRHTEDLFSMTAQEQADAMTLAGMLRRRALAGDPGVTGFTVGANCGSCRSAGDARAHPLYSPPRRHADQRRDPEQDGVLNGRV